ncbi:hypothetical protein [Luteimonas cellulosilyticus]|uniref:hypothetical protein n=1 Tax=Luteimonas cellulosilyticus TaxID=2683586 RepID=UPI00135A3A32|nr:hypothetical protein [Luteimonas cellulosilyticus]
MMRTLTIAALTAALPVTASAAEGLSYNYVEGGYAASNSELALVGRDVDADGWALRGSAAFLPNFHAFGDYARESFDDSLVRGSASDLVTTQRSCGVRRFPWRLSLP